MELQHLLKIDGQVLPDVPKLIDILLFVLEECLIVVLNSELCFWIVHTEGVCFQLDDPPRLKLVVDHGAHLDGPPILREFVELLLFLKAYHIDA